MTKLDLDRVSDELTTFDQLIKALVLNTSFKQEYIGKRSGRIVLVLQQTHYYTILFDKQTEGIFKINTKTFEELYEKVNE